MTKTIIRITEPFIRLDNLLKFAGVTVTGGQAKMKIQAGEVKLNGETCLQRGKKLRVGDVVEVDEVQVSVAQEEPEP